MFSDNLMCGSVNIFLRGWLTKCSECDSVRTKLAQELRGLQEVYKRTFMRHCGAPSEGIQSTLQVT